MTTSTATTAGRVPISSNVSSPVYRRVLTRFPYTSVATAFALVIVALGLFFNVDVFELSWVALPGIDPRETGEVVAAFLMIVPAIFIDHIVSRRRAHDAQLVADQLRVLHVTMRTVQDIVSNALMSLYAFRAEAQPHVSPQAVELFDHIIADTALRLQTIGNLEKITEKTMAMGMGLDYPNPAAKVKT
jgi:hypothetical protein